MSDDRVKIITTVKEIRVFNDPYRKEILKTLSLFSRPATSKEVAVEMNEAPSKINYHMGILQKHGFVELDHTKSINGITAKYFALSMSTVKIDVDSDKNNDFEIAAAHELISSAFDNEKNNYIRQLSKFIEIGGEQKDEYFDFINTKKVYMNSEEYKEFVDFMKKLSKKEKEGREVYSLFASLIKQDIPK